MPRSPTIVSNPFSNEFMNSYALANFATSIILAKSTSSSMPNAMFSLIVPLDSKDIKVTYLSS